MKIRRLDVSNYKSLSNVSFSPRQISLLVGANASGKTNVVDCFDFLSDVFRFELEYAISHKGGFNAIVHRGQKRRLVPPISIATSVQLTSDELGIPRRLFGRPLTPTEAPENEYMEDLESRLKVRIRHRFILRAVGSSIGADYKVAAEVVRIHCTVGVKWRHLLTIRRKRTGTMEAEAPDVAALGYDESQLRDPDKANTLHRILAWLSGSNAFELVTGRGLVVSPGDTLVNQLANFFPVVRAFRRALSAIRVYQMGSVYCRQYASPSPRPELSRFGENLPSVILQLQRARPEIWELVMDAMQSIIPELRKIEVKHSPSRQLGIVFWEEGFPRPWTVEEVSDGTIQTLATLVAIFDPGVGFFILEEPENSVHPWIVRHVIRACEKASHEKQVLLTSHSPIVIDQFAPRNVFVIWRTTDGSHLAPLLRLDPKLRSQWNEGKISTFEFLDSGIMREAVPPRPNVEID